MPRSIWNGVISFGMVSIPVKLYAATENKDIAFHQLHEECETRIKYQKFCPHCERTVESEEIEKGYEFAKGHYVVLNDADFEQLPLPSKHAIDVTAFVKSEQIDPVYYEKTYYLEPDEAALRPFALFMKAIQEMDMVAIASITLRNKERLCGLRPLGGTLILDTLLYPDEIRVSDDTEMPSVKVSEKELEMAEHLIKLMAQDFKPEEYHDHYREALKKMIEAKLEGKEIVAQPDAPKAKVIDLMDALRASVDDIKARGKVSLADRDRQESNAIKAVESSDTGSSNTGSSGKSRNRSSAKSEESGTGEAAEKPRRRAAARNQSETHKTAAKHTARKRKESA